MNPLKKDIPYWYAAYTKPRNEKKILARLLEQGIEAYLPLQRVLKQWSDRKKWVEEPLFRSYIFVRIAQNDYLKVLNTVGVVRYITFEGKAVKVPDSDINLIKTLLQQNLEIETTQDAIAPGTKVEVILGNFAGIKGELVEHAGKQKVIIRIETINHSMLVTLPKGYIARSI